VGGGGGAGGPLGGGREWVVGETKFFLTKYGRKVKIYIFVGTLVG
jgi:hypothetical protein